MDANIGEVSKLSDPAPRLLHVSQMLAFYVAGDDMGVVLLAGDGFVQLHSHRAEIERLTARLGVWKEGQADLFELKGDESMWDKRYKGRLGSLAGAGDAWWVGAIRAGIDFKDIGTAASFDKVAAVLREQRPLIRLYTDDTTSSDNAIAPVELVATLGWSSSVISLQKQKVPVKFARPKEGALTWVCGMMLHAQAPKLNSAYDILDSLLCVPTGEHVIGLFGYGSGNKKAFDKFDDATLAGMGLARDPKVILSAGHFMIPQTLEWTAKVSTEFEQIKSGF